jgi:ParB-like chromosome segregation protein Spo0J
MHVEMREVADIKSYPQNPRHNDRAVQAVAVSIRTFGFRQPLVLDEDSVIVVGATRCLELRAARARNRRCVFRIRVVDRADGLVHQ